MADAMDINTYYFGAAFFWLSGFLIGIIVGRFVERRKTT
jgi:hypothetical protein